MDYSMSLCITYAFKVGAVTRKSVYRIADLFEGRFYPINPSDISDDSEKFSPKFIRCLPDDEGDYCVPTLRKWHTIIKKGSLGDERLSTESYRENSTDFFEMILDREFIALSQEQQIQKLKDGFFLPEGAANNLLLALEEDDQTYTVAQCRRSDFKVDGVQYKLDQDLGDTLHTKHYFSTFTIDKSDIWNTAGFDYFYTAQGVRAKTRTFYCNTSLPQSNGILRLYSIQEYLPYFALRFMKIHAKEFGITKNERKELADKIGMILSSDQELLDFYKCTGYDEQFLLQQIKKYNGLISSYLGNEDNIDELLLSILQENDLLQEKYIRIAKDIWLQAADQQRTEKCTKLTELTREISEKAEAIKQLNESMEELEGTKEGLKEKIVQMEHEQGTLQNVMNNIFAKFDEKVCECIGQSSIYRYIACSNSEKAVKSGATGIAPLAKSFCVYYADSTCEPAAKTIDKDTTACLVLEKNLGMAGVPASYRSVLSRILVKMETPIHSIITSGFHCRNIANAISYSLNGKPAMRISVTKSTVEYDHIYETIQTYNGKVVLIENLLDYCCETIYSLINKDFTDKVFVFSVENEATFALLSQSIWNYGILLNSDFMEAIRQPQFIPALISDDIPKYKMNLIDEVDEKLQSVKDLLLKVGYPIPAVRMALSLITALCDNFRINTDGYIDSVLAKLGDLYRDVFSSEELENLTELLPDDLVTKYNF